MKHKHHEIIAEWIKDTTKVVQYRRNGTEYRWKEVLGTPQWFTEFEYRFMPGPKPDVVRCEPVHLSHDGTVSIKDVGGTVSCRFVFDGETRKLKSAEVLK